MKKKYIAPQIIISHLHTEVFLAASNNINLKSATPFPKCYLHKEKWTFDS